MTGLEGLLMLLPWLRRDIRDYERVDNFRWINWGYVWNGDYDRFGLERPAYWYVLIRLPSYCMETSLYRSDSAEPIMMQRCLLFKEPVPAGNSEWKQITMECA